MNIETILFNVAKGLVCGYSHFINEELSRFRNPTVEDKNGKKLMQQASLAKRIALEPVYAVLAVASAIEFLVRLPLTLISFLALKLKEPKKNIDLEKNIALACIATCGILGFLVPFQSIANLFYNCFEKNQIKSDLICKEINKMIVEKLDLIKYFP